MTNRIDRYARALPILAMAAAGVLVSAQTAPTGTTAPLPAAQAATDATPVAAVAPGDAR